MLDLILNVLMMKFVCCSNVAYHGELEKKAAMEQKRVMSGENGDFEGECQLLQEDLVL